MSGRAGQQVLAVDLRGGAGRDPELIERSVVANGRPARGAECPLQFEAKAVDTRLDAAGNFAITEAQVLRVHARHDIVVPGTSYVDPREWSPLIYNFRHYFDLGAELGETFRTETPGRERVPAPLR
jgi:hypothetical protein